MKITTKLIKQLIKEELKLILENPCDDLKNADNLSSHLSARQINNLNANDMQTYECEQKLIDLKQSEVKKTLKGIANPSSKEEVMATLKNIPGLEVYGDKIYVEKNEDIIILNTIIRTLKNFDGFEKTYMFGQEIFVSKWKDV